MNFEQQAQKLQRALIEMHLRIAAKEEGLAPGAIDDVVMYHAKFRVSLGDQITVSSEAGETPSDWLRNQRTAKSHWFAGAATDSGQETNKGGDATGPNNPWTAEHWNLTSQAQIINQDEKKAEAMAKAAGLNDVISSRPKAKK